MKQDDLYQKTRGNVIFFVCMRRHYRRGITPLAKKQKCPEKIHLRATSPASPKKVIFILDSSYFCWNTTFIYTLERAQEAATGDVLQEKACLEISQNSQGRTCARASFLIKLRLKTCNFIRPAVLLKKKLWHRCFKVGKIFLFWPYQQVLSWCTMFSRHHLGTWLIFPNKTVF